MAEATKINGGMGTLLTTLASGDNFSKLLMVGLLVGNMFITKQDGSATRSDVDKARQIAAKQIKAIYLNQAHWAEFEKSDIQERELIMESLNIPKDKWPKQPDMKIHTIEDNP